jgi:hypothetical protein
VGWKSRSATDEDEYAGLGIESNLARTAPSYSIGTHTGYPIAMSRKRIHTSNLDRST